MSKNIGSKCVLCGDNKATTNEHIPPKGIFLKPRPSNLITVPACDNCNNGSSKADEYFTVMLAIAVGHQNDHGKAFFQKARRTIRYKGNSKLQEYIRNNLLEVPVSTESGIYLGKHHAIKVNPELVKPVLIKITKGLFFKLSNKILAKDAKIKFSVQQKSLLVPNAGFNKDVFELCSPHMITEFIRDEFSYKFGVVDDAENSSIGFYQFYNAFYVTVTTLDKKYAEEKLQILANAEA